MKSHNFRIIGYLFLAIPLLLFFEQCASRQTTQTQMIRIKGSDTMRILGEKLAQIYMSRNSGVSVYVEGGGSATGVDALVAGSVNICAASRVLRPAEVSRLAEKYGSIGISFRIAKDALSVYVNPQNPVNDLTLKQLKLIFSGQISNWSAVGGNDLPIMVLIRPPNSGTFFYFKEHILEGQGYAADAQTVLTTALIVEKVKQNPAAIGYGGIAYGPSVTHCRINGIPPTEENVRYDLYPISRYLYFYTISKPEGITAKFIDWVLSREGQQIVEQVGYIPLWPNEQ
jgi:phosphate transport system substrate-binding protein